MSPSKEVSRNMSSMSLTDETFQEDRGWLNAESRNMPFMLVTDETSHPEMSPSKEVSRNMSSMLVTLDRSGASVALCTILYAPLNASSIVSHCMAPHWSIERNLAAAAELSPSVILVRSPDILTV